MSKEALHTGISRVYRKRDDEGEDLPPESQIVQTNTRDALQTARTNFEEAWNITATKEWANCSARADVIVDSGETLVTDAPVTYLLFLEKQLADLRTLIARLPVLDPAEKWEWDGNANAYASEPRETHRTRKVPKVIVKYDATPEHPAQTEMFTEDVIVGFWETIKFSGAMPAEQRLAMLNRVDAALKAVKVAREAANDVQVEQQHVAAPILDYVIGGA